MRGKYFYEKRGATTAEAGMLVGLIAIALLTSLTLTGDNLNRLFGGISNTLFGTTQDKVVLAEIAEQNFNENTILNLPLSITSDQDLSTLSIQASSDNTELLPDTAFSATFSDGTWILTLTPTADLFGTAEVTVMVTGTEDEDSKTFTLTVNEVGDPPVINFSPTDFTINEDTIWDQSFTISDADTPLADLIVTATTTYNDLISDLSVVGEQSGYNLSFNPYKDGNATVILSVDDGQTQVNLPLTFTITPVDDDPIFTFTIDARISDPILTVPLTITDEDDDITTELPTVTVSGGNYDVTDVTGSNGYYTVTLNQTQQPSANVNVTLTATFDGVSDSKTVLYDRTGGPTYSSCKEILENYPESSTGGYVIDPDGDGSLYDEINVECDMSTDGGGWTQITLDLARNTFGGDIQGYQQAVTSFEGDKPRAYKPTVPGVDDNNMTVWYDFAVPFGYDDFYIGSNYQTKIYIPNQSAHTWDWAAWSYAQYRPTTWWVKHAEAMVSMGFIAFGSSSASGPSIDSLTSSQTSQVEQTNGKVRTFTHTGTIYSVNNGSKGFRIMASERGFQEEGIVMWNSGYIYVR